MPTLEWIWNMFSYFMVFEKDKPGAPGCISKKKCT